MLTEFYTLYTTLLLTGCTMYSMANLMVSRRCGVGNNHKKPKSICASPAVVMPVVVVVVVIVVEVYISVRLPFAVHFVPFFPFFSVPMSDNVHSQYHCANQQHWGLMTL